MDTDETEYIEEGDVSMFTEPEGSDESDGGLQQQQWGFLADYLLEDIQLVKHHRPGQGRKCGNAFFSIVLC